MTIDRKGEWAGDFMSGRMSLHDFAWLGRYIEDKLKVVGVPAPTARSAAETLQVDIAELFEARAQAEWGLDELARLDEQDRLRAKALA